MCQGAESEKADIKSNGSIRFVRSGQKFPTSNDFKASSFCRQTADLKRQIRTSFAERGYVEDYPQQCGALKPANLFHESFTNCRSGFAGVVGLNTLLRVVFDIPALRYLIRSDDGSDKSSRARNSLLILRDDCPATVNIPPIPRDRHHDTVTGIPSRGIGTVLTVTEC